MNNKKCKNENKINPTLPSGVKDILPLEAKELKSTKKRLAKMYESWGFEEVFTPSFEYLDVLSLQAGERIKKEMFKFLDDRGDLLALRPDMTISIARLVSQKLSEKPLPLRLFYQSNVFRQKKPLQGQPREFWQSGIELIGGDQITTDAEIVLLLLSILKKLKIKNFKLGLGSVSFVKALLDDFSDSKRLKKYLSQKNMVAVEEILAKTKSEKAKKLKEILKLKGEEALKWANKIAFNSEAKKSLIQLNKVAALVRGQGYGQYVTYDFSLVPDFDYYTGIVFEVYVDGLGVSLAGGGRYDNLLSNLGKSYKAAGFAVGLERLNSVMVNQGQNFSERKAKVIVQGLPSTELFSIAKYLRQRNFIVKIQTDAIKNPKQKLLEYGAKWIITIEKDRANIFGAKEKSMSLTQLKRWLENA